jgi:hypothetical protein
MTFYGPTLRVASVKPAVGIQNDLNDVIGDLQVSKTTPE